MTQVAKGREPSEATKREREYLLLKLEEARKDCQWLLGLAAASVLGVVLKDDFGITTPRLKATTLAISVLQILITMLGAVSWHGKEIDPADDVAFLTRRLKARHDYRSVSIILLSVSFILIAVMGWGMIFATP